MSIAEELTKQLPALCGTECYFSDREGSQHLSGIYTVASMELQDPATETVLIFRDRQQACVRPEFLAFNEPGRDIHKIERVALKFPDGSMEFKSVEVARVMLVVTQAKRNQSDVVATGKAMELMSQFRHNGHITNEGCILMTWEYYTKHHLAGDDHVS